MKIQVNKQDLVPVQHTALTKNINPKKEAVCNCCRKVYAIVDNGEKIIPLYKHFSYYIVTEKGKTFGNLTYKKES